MNVSDIWPPGTAGNVPGTRPEPEEIDSEQLLAQGDELLKSSRQLLEQLEERIEPRASGNGA